MLNVRCETFHNGWEVTVFYGERLNDKIVSVTWVDTNVVASASEAIKFAMRTLPALFDNPEQLKCEEIAVPVIKARTCVECKHWWFYGGSPCYSEITHGMEWESWCEKKHWDVKDPHEIDQGQYAKFLMTARRCNDFELADYATDSAGVAP